MCGLHQSICAFREYESRLFFLFCHSICQTDTENAPQNGRTQIWTRRINEFPFSDDGYWWKSFKHWRFIDWLLAALFQLNHWHLVRYICAGAWYFLFAVNDVSEVFRLGDEDEAIYLPANCTINIESIKLYRKHSFGWILLFFCWSVLFIWVSLSLCAYGFSSFICWRIFRNDRSNFS